MSKFVGESEAEVRRVFRRARSQAPCMLFLDEVDTMAAKRSFTGQSGGASGHSLPPFCLIPLFSKWPSLLLHATFQECTNEYCPLS
jgi:hypothetical protein